MVQCLTADGELTTGATGRTTGNFIGSKGFVSEDTMRIQDSYYYQDFSYVVKIGESINEWRDSIRTCLLYTSPSPRDQLTSRMPSSA